MLLVEDEPLILMVLEDMLLDSGLDVMTSTHVGGAVKLLRDYPGHFSALVTDIHMPGELNGMDLVTHVREVYPNLPVVVSTGRLDVLTPDWIKAHRVTVVGKPYGMATQVETVRRLVG